MTKRKDGRDANSLLVISSAVEKSYSGHIGAWPRCALEVCDMQVSWYWHHVSAAIGAISLILSLFKVIIWRD